MSKPHPPRDPFAAYVDSVDQYHTVLHPVTPMLLTELVDTTVFLFTKLSEREVYEAISKLKRPPLACIPFGTGRFRIRVPTRQRVEELLAEDTSHLGISLRKSADSFQYTIYFTELPTSLTQFQEWICGDEHKANEVLSVELLKTNGVYNGRVEVLTLFKLPAFVKTPFGKVRVAPGFNLDSIAPPIQHKNKTKPPKPTPLNDSKSSSATTTQSSSVPTPPSTDTPVPSAPPPAPTPTPSVQESDEEKAPRKPNKKKINSSSASTTTVATPSTPPNLQPTQPPPKGRRKVK